MICWIDTYLLIISLRFLKVIDKFNYLSVSSYVTFGGKIFLLLHNGKSEDNVRAFFVETHEVFVKYMMNPFVNVDGPVMSPQFNTQIRNLAKRILA